MSAVIALAAGGFRDHVAVLSRAGNLVVTCATTGVERARYLVPGATFVSWARDTATLVCAGRTTLWVFPWNGDAPLVRYNAKRRETTALAVGHSRIAQALTGGTILLHNHTHRNTPVRVLTHSVTVRDMHLSPTHLVALSRRGEVRVWRLACARAASLVITSPPMSHVALSGGVRADTLVTVWANGEAAVSTRLARAPYGKRACWGTTSQPSLMAVHKDTVALATGSGLLEVYNALHGRCAWDAPLAHGAVTSLCFSPDGKYVALAYAGGYAVLLAAQSGRVVDLVVTHSPSPVLMGWTARATALVYVNEGGSQLGIWRAPAADTHGRQQVTYDTAAAALDDVIRYAARCNPDHTWSLHPGSTLHTLHGAASTVSVPGTTYDTLCAELRTRVCGVAW